MCWTGATAADEPDTDLDLLPDSWEQRWFTNLISAGLNSDSDGDHLTDRQEYVLGTDPTHPNAGLALQARPAGNLIEVSFHGQAAAGSGYQNAERHYGLESTTALRGGSWSSVSGFADRVVTSAAETLTCSVSPVPNQPTFFRVRIWLQQKQ